MADAASSISTSQAILKLTLTDEWSALGFAHFIDSLGTSYGRISRVGVLARISSPEELRKVFNASFGDENLGLEPFALHHRLYAAPPLMVHKIRIESPGWLEVIGALNPLKVIADFITDWRKENTARARMNFDHDLEVRQFRREFMKDLVSLAPQLREIDPSGELTKRLQEEAFEAEHSLVSIAQSDKLRGWSLLRVGE